MVHAKKSQKNKKNCCTGKALQRPMGKLKKVKQKYCHYKVYISM